MNRDQIAALARAVVTLAIGLAALYAIGRWFGWGAIGAIAITGIGAAVWNARRWRSW